MDALTKVVLFASTEHLMELYKEVSSDARLSVAGRTTTSDELKNILTRNKKAVVVFYTCQQQFYNLNKQMTEYFRENNILYLVVCGSATEGFDMLKQGASDMILLPKLYNSEAVTNRNFYLSLKNKIITVGKLYANSDTRQLKNPNLKNFNKIVAIGSSTGGTESIFMILKEFPEDFPPILIVQHMPPVFTKLYAERMNQSCRISVWEAKDKDMLRPGLALIAPGGMHMSLVNRGGSYYVECKPGEKVHGQCPAVDVLFESIAQRSANMSIGIILTGMGADGAKGLLQMKRGGAVTLGQDKESSIVYGMPKAAFDIGAVDKQVSLSNMAAAIMSAVRGR